MKANEFVKKFGWEEANSFVNWYGGKTSFKFLKVKEQTISVHSGDQPYDFHIDALKRLIESHELVVIHGFEKSKEIVANAPSDDHFYSWTLGDSGVRDKTVNIGALRKAIADVESCMEVSSESN